MKAQREADGKKRKNASSSEKPSSHKRQKHDRSTTRSPRRVHRIKRLSSQHPNRGPTSKNEARRLQQAAAAKPTGRDPAEQYVQLSQSLLQLLHAKRPSTGDPGAE